MTDTTPLDLNIVNLVLDEDVLNISYLLAIII